MTSTTMRYAYKIDHYKLEARISVKEGLISGKAIVRLSLRHQTTEILLDAFNLAISTIQTEEGRTLAFRLTPRHLVIELPEDLANPEQLGIVITYQATPKAGMYFLYDEKNWPGGYVCTLGEGGMAPNWMPTYAGTDMKYTTEMMISVPAGLTALSNGKLLSQRKEAEQTIFHWYQDKPHAGYLVTLNIGTFEEVRLKPSKSGVPLSVWVPPGTSSLATYAFRNTTQKLDYYSDLFGSAYPWDKYDHVVQPNFPTPGGMEHTSLTGISLYALRGPENAVDGEGPFFDDYHANWTLEIGIAHEMIHQWFGDSISCRTLHHIWINEGFATYFMLVWTEHAVSAEQFLFDINYAKSWYFRYAASAPVRPLHLNDFNTPGEAFEYHHTYLKAGLVLHMLRKFLGDPLFFHAIATIARNHAHSLITTDNLEHSLEEATGYDLKWFFDQWVRREGHPKLHITHFYQGMKKNLVLEVKQTQDAAPFILHFNVTLHFSQKVVTHAIVLTEKEHRFSFAAPEVPLFISCDNTGDLLVEFEINSTLDELVAQVKQDKIIGRVRAFNRLTDSFPHHPQTRELLAQIIETETFWPLKAEAAQKIHLADEKTALSLAEKALTDREYRVRKAAVLGLQGVPGEAASQLLLKVVADEKQENVVGSAIHVLAASGRASDDFLKKQLARDSWFDTIRLAAIRGAATIKSQTLIPAIQPFTSDTYSYWVREAALIAWEASTHHGDPSLLDCLHRWALTQPPLQYLAVETLGKHGDNQSRAILEKIKEQCLDLNLSTLCETALADIDKNDISGNKTQ